MKSLRARILAALCLAACAVPGGALGDGGPVQAQHVERIEQLFARNELPQAQVALDESGRVVLKGAYQDRKQVDLAFSLAQTVVGARWVSPVVPEDIKVKEWEKALSSFFPTTDAKANFLAADSSAPGPVRRKYALVVGIGKFRETAINRLKYPAKDAKDFYGYLVSRSGGNFKQDNVTLLTDAGATRANIAAALDRLRAAAQPDDLVLLYFSSHGTPPNINGSVNIVTYDTVVKPRQAIWESSVTDEMLRDFIQGVRAKRLIVVLDTCYSSGAYKRVDGFLPTGGKSLGIEDEGQGMSSHMAKKLLGAKDLVLTDDDAASTDNRTADDGWGRVLVSASGPEEKSWESEKLHNSFFTRHFIDGLKKYGNARQAFEYAKPRVTSGVLEEKQEQQHPQVAADKRNWAIAVAQ